MTLENVIKRIATKDIDEIEETVKFRAVAPILEELGWDVLDRKWKIGEEEVEFEESFDSESSRKADIALKSDGKYLAVVEVKRSSKGLEQVDLRQVVTYAHQLGVQIIALTNGKQWWMYSTSIPGLQFKDRRFLNLDIISSDPAKSAEELKRYLSRARLRNGSAVKSAEKKLKEQHAKQALIASIKKVWKSAYDEMVKDPDLFSDVVTYVFESISTSKKVTRNQIAQAILEMDEILETTLPSKSSLSKPVLQKPAYASKSKSKKKKGATGNASVKPGHVIVMGNRYEVSTYTDILFSTVHALHSKFGHQLRSLLSRNMNDVDWLLSTSKRDSRYKEHDSVPYWINFRGNAVTSVWKARRLLESSGESRASLKMFDTQGNEIEEKGSLVLLKKEN